MSRCRHTTAATLLSLLALLAASCSDDSSSKDAAWLDGDTVEVGVDAGDASVDSADATRDSAQPDADAALPDFGPDILRPDGFSNPNFEVTIVDAQGDVGRDVSIALDSSGVPQLAYQSANKGLRYAELVGVNFNVKTLDNASLAGEFSDIAVGGGVIAIAARTSGKPTLWSKANPWTSAPAANAGGGDIALFIDSSGMAHMCHNDSRGEVLHYTHQTTTGFQTEAIAGTVLSGQKLGAWCDIVVDSSGGVHVSYDNANWLNLGYAYKAPASSWALDVADSDNSGKVGSYTSIVLDSQGAPLIAYFRSVDNTVALAYQQSNTWTHETIDTVGAIAAYTSLAIDGGGALHASYYNSTTGALHYAKRASGASSWQKETVAMLGTGSGGFNDITVDTQNKAHIAFYNAAAMRLEYAKQK